MNHRAAEEAVDRPVRRRTGPAVERPPLSPDLASDAGDALGRLQEMLGNIGAAELLAKGPRSSRPVEIAPLPRRPMPRERPPVPAQRLATPPAPAESTPGAAPSPNAAAEAMRGVDLGPLQNAGQGRNVASAAPSPAAGPGPITPPTTPPAVGAGQGGASETRTNGQQPANGRPGGAEPATAQPGAAANTGQPPEPASVDPDQEVPDQGADRELIAEELAEHGAWGQAAAQTGSAESVGRASFVAEQVGRGLVSGTVQGGAMGFTMGAAGGLLKFAGKYAGPAGAVLGGAVALYTVASGQYWREAGEAVSRFGEGSDTYERLANSLAAASAVIDVCNNVLQIVAGVCGVLALASYAATALSLGALAPLAATLTQLTVAIGVVSMILTAVKSVVLDPLVILFRSLHTFKSQADPRAVEAEGAQLQAAGAQVGGALGGFLGAKAGEGAVALGARGVSAVRGRPGAAEGTHQAGAEAAETAAQRGGRPQGAVEGEPPGGSSSAGGAEVPRAGEPPATRTERMAGWIRENMPGFHEGMNRRVGEGGSMHPWLDANFGPGSRLGRFGAWGERWSAKLAFPWERERAGPGQAVSDDQVAPSGATATESGPSTAEVAATPVDATAAPVETGPTPTEAGQPSVEAVPVPVTAEGAGRTPAGSEPASAGTASSVSEAPPAPGTTPVSEPAVSPAGPAPEHAPGAAGAAGAPAPVAVGAELEPPVLVHQTHTEPFTMPGGASDSFTIEGKMIARRVQAADGPVTECVVKMHLEKGATGTDVHLEQVRNMVTASVDQYYNGPGHRLSNGDRLHVKVEFVASPQADASTVTVHGTGTGTTAKNYFMSDLSNPAAGHATTAHEVGHSGFAFIDEYHAIDRFVPDRHEPGARGVAHDDSLMGNYHGRYTEAQLHARHLAQIEWAIGRARGTTAGDFVRPLPNPTGTHAGPPGSVPTPAIFPAGNVDSFTPITPDPVVTPTTTPDATITPITPDPIITPTGGAEVTPITPDPIVTPTEAEVTPTSMGHSETEEIIPVTDDMIIDESGPPSGRTDADEYTDVTDDMIIDESGPSSGRTDTDEYTDVTDDMIVDEPGAPPERVPSSSGASGGGGESGGTPPPAPSRGELPPDTRQLVKRETQIDDRTIHISEELKVGEDLQTGRVDWEEVYWTRFDVDENGVMTASVRTADPVAGRRSPSLRLRAAFERALTHFRARGIEVRQFQGDWSYMSATEPSVNYQAFEANLQQPGATRESAARATPSGRVASDYFQSVQVGPTEQVPLSVAQGTDPVPGEPIVPRVLANFSDPIPPAAAGDTGTGGAVGGQAVGSGGPTGGGQPPPAPTAASDQPGLSPEQASSLALRSIQSGVETVTGQAPPASVPVPGSDAPTTPSVAPPVASSLSPVASAAGSPAAASSSAGPGATGPTGGMDAVTAAALTASAMAEASAGAGPDAQPPLAADASGTVRERPNPEYRPPPGTLTEVDRLEDEIVTLTGARNTSQENASRLDRETSERAQASSAIAAANAGTQATAGRVANHQNQVNQRQQANEQQRGALEQASTAAGDYAGRAAGVATLRGLLGTFSGFLSLFDIEVPIIGGYILPASVRRGARSMKADSDHFLGQLRQVDTTMGQMRSGTAAGQQDAAVTGQRLGGVQSRGQATATQVDQVIVGGQALAAANTARATEAASARNAEQEHSAGAQDTLAAKQQRHDELLSQLQAWAIEHQQARAAATARAAERVRAAGMTVTREDPNAPVGSS